MLMRTTNLRAVLIPGILLAVAACGGGGGGGGVAPDTTIDPATEIQQLADAIGAKVGNINAIEQSGSPPAPSSDPAAPKASVGVESVTTTPGTGTVDIPVSFSATNPLASLFAKVTTPAGTPASGYLQVNVPSAKAFAPAKAGVPASTDNFLLTLDLPSNVGNGQFCVNLSGSDSEGLVSDVERVCVTIVTSITPPSNDQSGIATQILGTWEGPCIDFTDESGDFSARQILTFESGNAYLDEAEVWETAGCPPAQESEALPLFTGDFTLGTPTFVAQSQEWVTQLDFDPDPNILFPDATPCFNVVNVSGNQLFLGVPRTFTFSDEPDSNPCVSTGSRPTILSTGLAYTRVGGDLPTANAGSDQTVVSAATVTLSGTGSSDPDGQIVSHQWEQIGTPAVSLQNANTATASFTAPTVTQGSQVLTFRLTVTDNNNQTDTDDVTVTVFPVAVGTGELRFTLTWTTADDVDLYVKDPTGTTIFFGNATPANSAGRLDVDDQSGFGPENIFWATNPPDGVYCVGVDHFSGGTASTFDVQVSTSSALLRTFDDIALAADGLAGDAVQVTKVTKAGNNYTFSASPPSLNDPDCPVIGSTKK